MSMDDWGIELYGLEVNDFELNEKYDDFYSVEDALSETGILNDSIISYISNGQDLVYIGFFPQYPWLSNSSNDITREEVEKEIQKVLEEMCKDIPPGYARENCDYISTYGCQ